MSTLVREQLAQLFQTAIEAVEPRAAVQRALRRAGDALHLVSDPPRAYDLAQYERIFVLGAGKAAAPMAQAIEELLGDELSGGLVVTKYDHALPLRRVEVREAGHPLPDENGLRAGAEILSLAESATERDLVIFLLSGGGSALLEALAPELTLADLRTTTDRLLASGAPIGAFNTIRKHLSRLKGGRLAQAIAPANLMTLVLSDVVGSPLPTIASGPTVPDPTTWADVAAILEQYALELPHAVMEYLQAGIAGTYPDTPKQLPDAPVVIVGNNVRAVAAAQERARAMGYSVRMESATLEGEAREVGAAVARHAIALQAQDEGLPLCLLYGGESTVTLGATWGKGGRNQELALAAALELAGTEGITLGAFATDGGDGPTDSAGAIVDGGTVARGGGEAVARQHLDGHDSYPFLERSGDLVRTGATRTNVNDLLVVLLRARDGEY